jgi:hypothetical protein
MAKMITMQLSEELYDGLSNEIDIERIDTPMFDAATALTILCTVHATVTVKLVAPIPVKRFFASVESWLKTAPDEVELRGKGPNGTFEMKLSREYAMAAAEQVSAFVASFTSSD